MTPSGYAPAPTGHHPSTPGYGPELWENKLMRPWRSWWNAAVTMFVSEPFSDNHRRGRRIATGDFVDSLDYVIFFHVAAIHGRPHRLLHGAWVSQTAAVHGVRLVHWVVARPGSDDVGIHPRWSTGTATATMSISAPACSDSFSFSLVLFNSRITVLEFCW